MQVRCCLEKVAEARRDAPQRCEELMEKNCDHRRKIRHEGEVEANGQGEDQVCCK